MRILHIDTGRELRGGQRQVLVLMRGLRERGHECELLARPHAPLWEAARLLGFRAAPATLWNLRRHSSEVNIVHAHNARAHTLAAIASRSSFVVSRRVAFPVQGTFFSRWKYSRAERYLAVSGFVRQELIKAGIPERKIDLVYDGFERTVAPVSREHFRVVALDSADPRKSGALIRKSAEKAGIPVHFSADLEHDLPSASVFLYATESEGLGSAALLAMSLEIPVIASQVGGLPEIIDDGVTGLLVENTPESFAGAILRLEKDEEARLRMGRNARTLVERDFTAERMIDRTLASYERALPG